MQRCADCGTWQWGPEWCCHACRSFEMGWAEAPTGGRIYSWERNYHPVHPALRGRDPYVVVLVELPGSGRRAHGRQPPRRPHAGRPHRRGGRSRLRASHEEADPPYTLVQWRYALSRWHRGAPRLSAPIIKGAAMRTIVSNILSAAFLIAATGLAAGQTSGTSRTRAILSDPDFTRVYSTPTCSHCWKSATARTSRSLALTGFGTWPTFPETGN